MLTASCHLVGMCALLSTSRIIRPWESLPSSIYACVAWGQICFSLMFNFLIKATLAFRNPQAIFFMKNKIKKKKYRVHSAVHLGSFPSLEFFSCLHGRCNVNLFPNKHRILLIDF